MKYVNKITNGLLYVGLIGASAIGILSFASIIIREETPLYGRIITAIVVVGLFAVGYAQSEGGEKSGAKDEKDNAN